MNSKTKLTLTVTAMVMVTLIAIVSIIAVFAARTQNFTTNITVKYTASQIAGKVSAKYYIGPDDTAGTSMTTTGKEGGATELVFRPGDKQLDPNTLNPLEDIILDVEDTASNIPDKSWVVFEYVFQNGLGTKIDTDYMAVLSFDGVADNIRITSRESNQKITDFSQIVSEVTLDYTHDLASKWFGLEHNENEEDDYISTKYFYVKAEIDDVGKSASFSGNFNWNLEVMKPTPDKLVFNLVDDSYSVSINRSTSSRAIGGSFKIDGDVIIPRTYTGSDGVERPVKEISDGGFRQIGISGHLYIPNSITTIDDLAFISSSIHVGDLIISDNVTSIGRRAFYGLDYESLTIGKNVASIGESAFNTRMKNIVVSADNQTYTSRDKSGKECNVLIEKDSKTILCGCINSIIPEDDSVTKIGNSAFSDAGICNINLPDNIIEIGDNAFESCYDLLNIIIPQGVTNIGEFAFGGCSSLISINIPSKVSLIGYYAFGDCLSLTEVIIDSQTICQNLIEWEKDDTYTIKPNLIDNATTIKAKYEIDGIDGYTNRAFIKSESQDVDGYWVYTKSSD